MCTLQARDLTSSKHEDDIQGFPTKWPTVKSAHGHTLDMHKVSNHLFGAPEVDLRIPLEVTRYLNM